MCRAAARNLELLTRLGVTHVLNTAEGVGIRLYCPLIGHMARILPSEWSDDKNFDL